MYDVCLGLFALIALFVQKIVSPRKQLLVKQRLGFDLPMIAKEGSPRIWIHATSVGESRAIQSLLKKIRSEHRHAAIFVSTTTQAGLELAKRSLKEADQFFLLPLDFSWTMRRLHHQINADLLILVEGDLWYNMTRFAKKTVVVSAKLSERSFNRFHFFRFFTKRLFSQLTLVCAQNQVYADRFLALGMPPDAVLVTGNLKLDMARMPVDVEEWRRKLGIREG